jgi:Family of unknown function (DUF6788)
MKTPAEVPASVREFAAVLSHPKPMRRGSVSERTMKCGQSGCPCHQDPKARHGPYFSLTRPVAGKTQSRYLNREQAAIAEQQIADGHRFREQLEDYWAACEQWADAQLEGSQAAATAAAKKGGSRRNSNSKSAKKSKPS